MPDTFQYLDISGQGSSIQHRVLSAGETLSDGTRVRYRVDHDTSYASQSSAYAEVWSPAQLQWNKAADYLYSAWAEDTTREDKFTGGGYQAYIELRYRVRALLGVD